MHLENLDELEKFAKLVFQDTQNTCIP